MPSQSPFFYDCFDAYEKLLHTDAPSIQKHLYNVNKNNFYLKHLFSIVDYHNLPIRISQILCNFMDKCIDHSLSHCNQEYQDYYIIQFKLHIPIHVNRDFLSEIAHYLLEYIQKKLEFKEDSLKIIEYNSVRNIDNTYIEIIGIKIPSDCPYIVTGMLCC